MISVQRVFMLILFVGFTAHAKFDLNEAFKLNLANEVSTSNEAAKFSAKMQKNITTTDSSKSVMRKMVDNSINYIWETSGLKNTSVGRVVKNVETKMRADLDLGQTTGGSKKTDHKLSFRLLAAQTLAKIEYLGWFKGSVQYNARTTASVAEVTQNISKNQNLIFSHTNIKSDNCSQISYQYEW